MTDKTESSKEIEFREISMIEVNALRKCIDAIEALQEAEQETSEKIAADHIESAVNQIILAMKAMGA